MWCKLFFLFQPSYYAVPSLKIRPGPGRLFHNSLTIFTFYNKNICLRNIIHINRQQEISFNRFPNWSMRKKIWIIHKLKRKPSGTDQWPYISRNRWANSQPYLIFAMCVWGYGSPACIPRSPSYGPPWTGSCSSTSAPSTSHSSTIS